jgi:flavorubredoxin
MKIKGKIYYVGVNDRHKNLFEGLWPLPNGVSYNSYLIDDDSVTLIDTVEVDFFETYLKNIHAIIGDRKIDYLVINHMEPDHSGSITLIKKYYPDIVIVGNKKTFEMVDGFYGIVGENYIVSEGSELNIGHHKLTFAMIPMVHWPETMVTIDTTDHVVFTGDAFGCFGALNGGIIDSQIRIDEFWSEMERYYSNIVGKYGGPVQKALKKLEGVQIDAICSTHGPVWTVEVPRVMEIYDRLSKYETQEGIVICYGTMYGNTERMAETIARAASEAGIRNIVMYNVSKTHHSYIIADVFRYRGLIVGAPTYNTGLYTEMDVLINELANRDIKNHYLGWFGSFAWAGQAVKKIGEYNNTRLHFEPVGEPVEMKQSMKEDDYARCEALGKAMAERLISDREDKG